MTTVNVHEAKTHFSKLLQRAASGEEIIIARAGKPVAMLIPVPTTPVKRMPGRDRGKIFMHPGFDDPIPEFDEYF
jgi:prevent-host-death family protein